MNTPLPKGFRLAAASAGFKKPGKPDLTLALCDTPATAAGVFTTNLFKAAPVQVAQAALMERETMRAVLINTGQANACTGFEGVTNCRRTLEMAGATFGLNPAEILPASTGVIGAQLKMDLWEQAMPQLVAALGKTNVEEYATAIMTTDAFPKYAHEVVQLSGGLVTLTGTAKGAGMICPNMATMLSVVLCDAAVAPELWRPMFVRAAEFTYNRATVDGDTSTNDTLYGLAGGASGIRPLGADLDKLEEALVRLLGTLAYMLVKDGEGATKVMMIRVRGAATREDAEKAARTVGHSQLVKTAMYGRDANWGRIVAALGRSGASFKPAAVRVSLCGVELFANEQPTNLDFDALLKKPLEHRDLPLDIILGDGPGSYELLASDLGHEYVNVNADYRS